jgi:CHAT domain-containing protein
MAEVVSRGGLSLRNVPVRLHSVPQTRSVDTADLGLLPRLPDTADDIRAMAAATRADLNHDIFLGKAASESSIRRAPLGDYRVVAFATHGLVPGDLDGLVEPALALTAPRIAGDEDGDGLLTMGEIFELELNADWVVLSACNTGTGAGAGAEAVSGLGRAFFYTGTRALLVSNWPVETSSARILTTDVFSRQAGDSTMIRAEALRQAQVALVDSPGFLDPATGKPAFSYAHPIFWAPFSLIGEGGGVQAALDARATERPAPDAVGRAVEESPARDAPARAPVPASNFEQVFGD